MTEPPTNIFALVLDKVRAANTALAADGVMPPGLDQSRIVVEPPRDPTHGDMATNAAMVLAKDAGKKPRELAEAMARQLGADDLVQKVEVAGPGFINLTLKPAAWTEALRAAIRAGTRYGRSDAGAQVDVLARSAFLRYREALGDDIGTIPEGLYPGDYLKPVGEALAAQYGRALNQKPESDWLPVVRATAIDMMMAMIRADL